MLRHLPIALLLMVVACRPAADPGRLLGRWENASESVEFFADGTVRLRIPARTAAGTYGRVSRGRVRVVLGGVPGTNTFYARRRGDRLDLCMLPSYRHCIQYHRPWQARPAGSLLRGGDR